MKKSVIYFRVSTTIQDETSQLEDLRRWAKSNDYEVVKVFGEAKSGYDPNVDRQELQKLKDYVVKEKIPNVLIWDLTRLGRSTRQTLDHIEFFKEHNINVVFKKEGLQTLTGGSVNQFFIEVLSSLAGMERNTLIERTKVGRIEAATKGKAMNWSNMPLGYSKDENKYIILNQKEVPLVIEIYKRAASGWTTTKIANDLNARGIPSFWEKSDRNKVNKRSGKSYKVKWGARTIDFLIKNTRYKGYREYAGRKIEIPRIVSDELWDEANRRISENLGYLNRAKHDYLFKGKVVCGHCLYTTRIRRRERPSETGNRSLDVYYQCTSHQRTGEENCKSGRFNLETFDKAIYDNAVLSILTYEIRGSKSKTVIKEANEKIEYWKDILVGLERERTRTLSLFKKGFISEKELEEDMTGITKKINEADSEVKRTQALVDEYQKPDDLTYGLMKKIYWEGDYETKRAMVEDHIKRIAAYGVDNILFDITEYFGTYYKDSKDGKHIIVGKGPNFQKPRKNGTLWYVEIFTKFETTPIKCLISSTRGINLIKRNLKYDIVSRSVSLT